MSKLDEDHKRVRIFLEVAPLFELRLEFLIHPNTTFNYVLKSFFIGKTFFQFPRRRYLFDCANQLICAIERGTQSSKFSFAKNKNTELNFSSIVEIKL